MPFPHVLQDAQPRPVCRTGPQRVTIISASVGAGHDGAAAELTRRLEAAGFTVDRHDFLDLLPSRLGRILSSGYHRLLVRAPAGYQRIYAALESKDRPGLALRALLRSAERGTLRAIAPDTGAVVSTYPGASQVLGALRRRGALGVPALTYLTDFSVHPLWIAPGIDAHLATHPVPAEQARARSAAHVLVTGPVTGSRFVPATEAEKRAARECFGLPEDAALALLVAGSWGVGAVRRSAREIRDSGSAVPVVVCGRNQALAEQLRADGFDHVRGWEGDMPGLMRACDVLVQNAGGLSSLEAFASGLPVMSYRSIPGHGLTNSAALDQAGLALWVRDRPGLGPALSELAAGPLGERQRAAGLALCPAGPGPAEVVAAAAAGGVAEIHRLVTRQGTAASSTAGARPGRSRVKTLAAALALAVGLTIGAPLTHGYKTVPSRLSTGAHRLLEKYER